LRLENDGHEVRLSQEPSWGVGKEGSRGNSRGKEAAKRPVKKVREEGKKQCEKESLNRGRTSSSRV